MKQILAALLTPRELGKNMTAQRPNVLGLSRVQVPTCPHSTVKLTEDTEVVLRQFANTQDPYTDNYAQLARVYSDRTSSERDFSKIAENAAKCPSNGHVDSEQISGKKVRLQYNYNWRMEKEDEILGWRHIRCIQRNKFSLAAGKSNTIDLVYDYLLRGNTILTSAYFKRLPPGSDSKPNPSRAAELLNKQLQMIG